MTTLLLPTPKKPQNTLEDSTFVVSGVSTVNEPLSKWIDIQLQQVIRLCPAYPKDSWQLLRELHELPPLPPDAICFTADAVPMYTNINNQHGIETIGRWLNLHRADLPTDFPSLKILEGLDIIMRNNVFSFGNRFSRKRTAQPWVPRALAATLLFTTAITRKRYFTSLTLLPSFTAP